MATSKAQLLEKPINTPGYFQHEILGEQDVRFVAHYEATLGAKTELAKESESTLNSDEAHRAADKPPPTEKN